MRDVEVLIQPTDEDLHMNYTPAAWVRASDRPCIQSRGTSLAGEKLCDMRLFTPVYILKVLLHRRKHRLPVVKCAPESVITRKGSKLQLHTILLGRTQASQNRVAQI